MGAFAYGFISAKYQIFPYHAIEYLNHLANSSTSGSENQRPWLVDGKGRWRLARNRVRDMGLTGDQETALKNISAMPYLRGSRSAPSLKNVTVYDKQTVYDGLNFVVSGHSPGAFLMDMEGNILHRWTKKFEEVWPGPVGFEEFDLHKQLWRRAFLLSNGDVLVIFEGLALIKLDKDSNLLWIKKIRPHHDLFIDETGNIYVLTRRQRETHNRLSLKGPILEDFITILNFEGKEIRKVSLLECFFNSDYASLLTNINKEGDIFHTNTIELLDGTVADRYPMFKKGNALISIPTLHAIAVVDLQLEKITWMLAGMWKYQHEPTLLKNGNLMLFDNWGNDSRSKVIEFNPLTQQIVWAYKGSSTDEFFSETCGTNQRLPNGNTLITESDNGRAIEVTSQNEIVWEFINPFRAGENDEYIATLFEVLRVDPNQLSKDWDWMGSN